MTDGPGRKRDGGARRTPKRSERFPAKGPRGNTKPPHRARDRDRSGPNDKRPPRLRFAKMHGLGNDFMVIDLVTQVAELNPDLIRRWADRRTGVGFDQLLAVLPPDVPQADFRYRVYNADGTEAEQCGNGARCFARFVAGERLTPKRELRLQTASGPMTVNLVAGGRARVRLPVPSIEPAAVPFVAATESLAQRIDLGTETVEATPVSVGNPHAVVFVTDVASVDVAGIGAALQQHAMFPAQVNVGFLQVVDEHFGQLRVYERGVGETRACGSGAAAAMVAAQLHRRWGQRAKVAMTGGKAWVEWQGSGTPVTLEGPAELVYKGWIQL